MTIGYIVRCLGMLCEQRDHTKILRLSLLSRLDALLEVTGASHYTLGKGREENPSKVILADFKHEILISCVR